MSVEGIDLNTERVERVEVKRKVDKGYWRKGE